MEFKVGNYVKLKDGNIYKIIDLKTLYNPINLNSVLVILVDCNGSEKRVKEEDVIGVVSEENIN